MHPVRKFILFRWALYLVTVLGVVGFVLANQRPTPSFSSDVVAKLTPKPVQAPDEAVVKTINSAVSVLKGERVPFGGVGQVEPSLIALHEEVTATGQKKLPVTLSALFLGPPKKYVIINGAVYETGDRLPDGRSVKDINPDGVVLAVGEVEEKIDWLPTFRVELKKASITGGDATAAGDQAAGQAQAAESQPAQKVDLANIPENPTPDQALNILQQLKKQQGQQQQQ